MPVVRHRRAWCCLAPGRSWRRSVKSSYQQTENARTHTQPVRETAPAGRQREKINVQVALENSNLVGIDSYITSLSDNISFTSLAEDEALRVLMSKVAQNKNWQTYFENYNNEKENLNPIYTTDTDSDKSAVIDQVLADSGLPAQAQLLFYMSPVDYTQSSKFFNIIEFLSIGRLLFNGYCLVCCAAEIVYQ